MAQSRLPTPKSYGYGSGSTRSQANGSPRASGVPNSTSPSRLPLSKPVSQVPSSPTKLPARKSSSRSHPAQPSKLPLSSSHGNGFPSSANGKPLRPPPMIQSTRKNSAQLYFEQVSPTSQHPPELPPEQQGPTSNLSSESSQESQRSYPLQTPETERPQPPSPTPQVHPISSNLSSDEAHERMLRAGMLRRLEDMFGPRVLDDVEPLSVISLGDSPTGDNLAASTNTNAMKSTSSELSKRWSAESAKAPSLKRTASGGSAGTEKKKRGGLFSSFRRSKKPDANSNAKGVSSADLPKRYSLQRPRVFGARLCEIPKQAMCATTVGMQRHALPVVVYMLVEEMYRRGLHAADEFRKLSDLPRSDAVQKAFETSPDYGDQVDLEQEASETVTDLFKRYLRELPDPVFDGRLWPLFRNACLTNTATHAKRIAAAQTILRLVPRRNFSLLIYLTAFFIQLSIDNKNELTNKDIGDLFGSSIFAPRTRGPKGTPIIDASASQESKEGLRWLLDHWAAICGAPVSIQSPTNSPLLGKEEKASTFSQVPAEFTEAMSEGDHVPPSPDARAFPQSPPAAQHDATPFPTLTTVIPHHRITLSPPSLCSPEIRVEPAADRPPAPTHETNRDIASWPRSESAPSYRPLPRPPSSFSQPSQSPLSKPQEEISKRGHPFNKSTAAPNAAPFEDFADYETEVSEEERMQARYMKSRQDGQEESDSEHTNSAQPRIPRHKAPSPMPNLCSLGETTDATSASHRDSYASDQYDFDTSQDESTRPDRIDRTSDVSFVSAREHIGAQNARRDKRNSNRHSLHQRPISEEDESHAPQDTTSIADWSSSKDLLISPTEEGCGPQLSALMDSVEGQDSDSDIIKYARRTCSKDSHSGDELEAPLFDEDPDSYRTSQDTTVGSSCEHQGKSREQEDLHRQLSRLNALVDSQRSHFDQDRDTMAAQMKRLESDLAQIQLCNSEQASASHRLETELFEAKQALRQSQLALRSSQDEMRSSQDDKVVAFERVGELEKRLERIEAERLSRSNEFNRMLLIITNTARERDLLKARLHKIGKLVSHKSDSSFDSSLGYGGKGV